MIFSRQYRHFQRYRQAVLVLVRHGYGFVVEQLGLTRYLPFRLRLRGPETTKQSPASRVRKVIEELGPTAVKIAQVVSTRPDLLPAPVMEELAKLQDEVPPVPFDQLQTILEAELGEKLETDFAHVDPEPLAAASIGQVHAARLMDGQEMVLKIRRPKIRQLIFTDLEILSDVAQIAEERTEWGQHHRVSEIVAEIRETLQRELDFEAEGRHAERLRRNLRHHETIVIPRVYWDYTSRRVLALQRLGGVRLKQWLAQDPPQAKRHRLARELASAQLDQVLIDGFFHADPHPGNLRVLPNDRLALMDFGMVGRLSDTTRQHVISMVMALLDRDAATLVRTLLAMGVVQRGVERPALERDVAQLQDRYYDRALVDIKLGNAVRDLFQVANRHHIRMPSDATMLSKALLTLEGVITQIDPGASLVELAEASGRRYLRQHYRPDRLVSRWLRTAQRQADLVMDLPARVHALLSTLERGELTWRLEPESLRIISRRLDLVSNRLSIAIILLALSMLISGLVIAAAVGGEGTFLWQFPVLELGLGMAILMLLWLVASILRSGRM